MSSPWILAVEDDEVDRAALSRAFARRAPQAKLSFAKDAFEALAILGRPAPDGLPLVILDQNMPKMSGLEFLALVRADRALVGLKVVVLTTSRNSNERAHAEGLGVLGFLIKEDMGRDHAPLFELLGL
jgi:CheY-like chemotaxis protein